MPKIPENGKYALPNNSDLFGNIFYTRNINFDEEGYIKLSPRMVSIQNSEDTILFGLPLAFGRINLVSFNLVTSVRMFDIALSETAISVAEDVDASTPSPTIDSHGRWYRNLWHATDTDDFFSKSGATWTDQGNLTAAKTHHLEVFRNRDTLCIGNGNVVSQFTNAYAASTNLTLPTDYEVTALAYSNYQMGIATVLSDDVSGQNQEAFFFIWDGSSAAARQGVSVGSDKVLAVTAYKGSWVLLTRAGQLLFWNGGGFQELASLPFYYRDVLHGASSSRDLFGDVMLVDGDVIYFNFNGLMRTYGDRFQSYLPNNPGGILCYDPKVGIYHRYSPSISPVSMLTVTSGNVNTTTNILTKTAGTIPTTGNPIKYTSDKTSQIGGLKVGKVYFCIKLSSTTFSLAETKELALAGTAIDLTSTGASNNYFMALEMYDFGTTLALNTGAIASIGTESTVCSDLISGATLNDFNSTSQHKFLNLIVKGFENRGYFVTPKIMSEDIEDTFQKITAKIRPLKDSDSIIVKYKNKELAGLPVSTPQASVSGINQCIWTTTNSFYTDADLSDAKNALDNEEELECEIIAGAGAGVLVKISEITVSGTRYVVVLDEEVIGAAAGRYSDVLIDNWKVYGTLTSSDTEGIGEIEIGPSSSWAKFKVELRGTDVAIEESEILNTKNR